jgi:hypothetical protein
MPACPIKKIGLGLYQWRGMGFFYSVVKPYDAAHIFIVSLKR